MSERIFTTAGSPEMEREASGARKRRTDPAAAASSAGEQLLRLQQTIGNLAVGSLLKSGIVQAKLTISQPNDRYEQEADRVAEQVLRTPAHPVVSGVALRLQSGGAGGVPAAPTATTTIDQFTEAAAMGDVFTMDSLLSGGVDINGKDSSGLTALMRAADAGKVKSIKFLIKNNADLTRVDMDKKTALFHAAENDQTDATKLLLQEGADPNVRADFDRTVLMATAEKGHPFALDVLIDGGANVDDTEQINGSTALMLAASNGHADAVSTLVYRGADITKADLTGQTALMVAAREGIASSLLGGMSRQRKERAKYVNARDAKGRTALMYAAVKGNIREVELLLRVGADVNIQDNDKMSAIIIVASNAVRGTDIYAKQSMLRALIKAKKVNLDLQDNENKTALMRAIEIGDVETVKTLVYEGANVDVEFAPGESALTMAKQILRQTSMQTEFTLIVKILESLPRKAGLEHK